MFIDYFIFYILVFLEDNVSYVKDYYNSIRLRLVRGIVCSIRFLYRYLHKRYFVMSSVFLLMIIIIIIWKCFIQCACNKNKKNSNKSFSVRKYELFPSEMVQNNNFYNTTIHSNILDKYLRCNKSLQDVKKYHYIVSQGDVLNTILMNHSNNGIDESGITLLLQQYPVLKQLKTGQVLSWMTITKKKLRCLVWDIFPQETRVYSCIHTRFTEGIIRVLDKLNNELSSVILFIGELSGTFIDSACSLGIEENYVVDIINALQYQLDFRTLRQGDRFSVLISIIIDDNQYIRSKLLGARLNTAGKDYYVFRANNGKFYDREAIRVGKNFIRFPTLKPFRISSNFNLSRVNPVTGQISPHAGVDFAVPVGTPVFSVGDGEVVVSAYSKIAGNYVAIKHGRHCITRYMHLKKLLVKPGQKVKKGDSIALSGNTGRSTGPHLHFEIWLNNRPVNPLTTKILNVEKLLGNERVTYLNQVNKILPQLNFD